MSRNLKKSAARLEREAEGRAKIIRRVIEQYQESIQNPSDHAQHLRKQREIERLVAEYVELHKALKQLRKKVGN